MAQVRAKEDCYLNEHGYHPKDEVFEYGGPEHDSLELLNGKPYKLPKSKQEAAVQEKLPEQVDGQEQSQS